MSLFELLQSNHNDLTDHDLAHLADWANDWKNLTPNPHWKRAFSLIREGADLLLRRRAMAQCYVGKVPDAELPPIQSQSPDYSDLRSAIGDYESTFYGPHDCSDCGTLIVKRAIEQGGQMYDAADLKSGRRHVCGATKLPKSSVPVNEVPCASY